MTGLRFLRRWYRGERSAARIADLEAKIGSLSEAVHAAGARAYDLRRELDAERGHTDRLAASIVELINTGRGLREGRDAQTRRANELAGQKAALEHESELIRRALCTAGCLPPADPIDDVVVGVQHLAAEYCKVRASRARAADRELGRSVEVARLTAAVDALQVRVSRTPQADLELMRKANLALSDRLAELERDRLERRVYELEGRAAPTQVITGTLGDGAP